MKIVANAVMLGSLAVWSGAQSRAVETPAHVAARADDTTTTAVAGGVVQGDEGRVAGAAVPDARPEAEASLTLGEDIAGEVFIVDADGNLVAQIRKQGGRQVSVPLDPGTYEVECVTEPQLSYVAVNLAEGASVVIGRDGLRPREGQRAHHPRRLKRQHVRSRPPRPTYDLRACRLTFDMGGWASGSGTTSIVITEDSIESHNGGFLGGMSSGYRVTPEWMVTLGVTSRLIEAHESDWRESDSTDHASFLTTVAVGARYYLPPLATRSGAKPYLSAGIGPTFGTEVESREWSWHHHDSETVRSEAVFGGYIGAGVDLQPTSWLVLGADVTYQISPKLTEPVGGCRETRGFTFAFQIGADFGRRLPKPTKR